MVCPHFFEKLFIYFHTDYKNLIAHHTVQMLALAIVPLGLSIDSFDGVILPLL